MKRGTAYGYGRIRTRPNGTFLADQYNGHGKRIRRTFKTKIEAQYWLDTQAVTPVALTSAQIAEASEAFALLPPGVSLLEALRKGLDSFVAPKVSSTPFHVLAEVFLSERSKELRPPTIANYRSSLNHAKDAIGDTLEAFTPKSIREYVGPLTPQNRNRNIRALSAFFSWCVEFEHVSQNPAKGIRLAKIAEPSRAVITPVQMEHLLSIAEAVDARTIPYFAICAFAGLRPSEARRLMASDIGAEYIRVASSQSKTMSARTVFIRQNLRSILARFPVKNAVTQGLSEARFQKRIGAVIKASQIEWVQDVLRHSFASYTYDLCRDAASTAAEMGHSGTATFFKHYRGLVPPGSGEKWFAIGAI